MPSSSKYSRDFDKACLAFAKSVEDQDDLVSDAFGEKVSGADLLRIQRNRIWSRRGAEELETMETEIDLGL